MTKRAFLEARCPNLGQTKKQGTLKFLAFSLAPQVGLEPTTTRLTAECSAIELLRNTDSGVFTPLIQWNPAATYSPGPCPAKYHRR